MWEFLCEPGGLGARGIKINQTLSMACMLLLDRQEVMGSHNLEPRVMIHSESEG